MQKNKLAEMPVQKLVYTMAVPLMLSLLIQSFYNIVDSIFVSRVSEQALTATSLAYPVQFLMIAISVGTAVGLNALLSAQTGRGRTDDACRAATTGLVIMLGMAGILSLLGIFFSGKLAETFTSNAEIAEQTGRYMMICVTFCHGIFIQTYAQRLLQAVGDTMLSMYSLIIGAVTNIVLDPILIFGLLGMPKLGITGAAIATVTGQWLGAAAALIFNKKKNPLIHVRFKGYRFLWQDAGEIFRVGLPTIIVQTLGSIMTVSVNAILIRESATAVAFFGVYYKLQSFLMMPMNGLGQAAIPIVGFNYGAGSKERIRETWKIMRTVAVIFALAGTAVFEIFPKQLLSFFDAGSQMLEIGVPALRIIAVTFILAAMTIIIGYFVSGFQNGTVNMVGSALRQLVALVPFIALFLQLWGIKYCWFAFWIAEGAAFIYSYMAFRREIKQKA